MKAILTLAGILAGVALLVTLAAVAVPMKAIWITLGVIGILLAGMLIGVFLWLDFLPRPENGPWWL